MHGFSGVIGRGVVTGAAGVLVVALCAGCGGATTVLTSAQAKQAVIPLASLGNGWKTSTDDDSSSSSLGCLDKLDVKFDSKDASSHARGDYEVSGDQAVTSVTSAVASYDDAGTVGKRLDAIKDAMAGCTEVDETDKDGSTIHLKVATDTKKAGDAVDEQVNVRATGTVSVGVFQVPVADSMSALRVDNHAVLIGFTDLAHEVPAHYDDLVEAAAQRVSDVAAGKKPSTAVIAGFSQPKGPGPSAGESGSSEKPMPFDGATYTWKSGVKMDLAVQKIAPAGRTDDLCGDGSCGVIEPEDTVFLLKYTVTVPADHDGPFDASSCPGELHARSGNDEDAFIATVGDQAKSLDGDIMPGASKYGVAEWVIKKAHASEQFYLESTCGDPDNAEETVYFGGTISKRS